VVRCAASCRGVDADEEVGIETFTTASSAWALDWALPERVLGDEARACWRSCRAGFAFVAVRDWTLGLELAGAFWRTEGELDAGRGAAALWVGVSRPR
jgi:hypothetical protein